MDEQQQEVIMDASAFEVSDGEEFPFVVMGPDDKPAGTIFMKALPMRKLDRYRDILNGLGRKKGNAQAAREYLFREAFSRFVPKEANAKLALNGHKSDLEFFIAKTPKTVDRVVLAYHQRNYTDVEDIKE